MAATPGRNNQGWTTTDVGKMRVAEIMKAAWAQRRAEGRTFRSPLSGAFVTKEQADAERQQLNGQPSPYGQKMKRATEKSGHTRPDVQAKRDARRAAGLAAMTGEPRRRPGPRAEPESTVRSRELRARNIAAGLTSAGKPRKRPLMQAPRVNVKAMSPTQYRAHRRQIQLRSIERRRERFAAASVTPGRRGRPRKAAPTKASGYWHPAQVAKRAQWKAQGLNANGQPFKRGPLAALDGHGPAAAVVAPTKEIVIEIIHQHGGGMIIVVPDGVRIESH